MNLYFLSLIQPDRVKRRKRCSIFKVDFSDLFKIKNRFRPQDGDIILCPTKMFFWINNICDVVRLLVSDSSFHPMFWEENQTPIYFHFSKDILKKISRSKLILKDSYFTFSKVKIGKSRFDIRITPESMTRRTLAYIISRIGDCDPYKVDFCSTKNLIHLLGVY
jgi:hypothetical protein